MHALKPSKPWVLRTKQLLKRTLVPMADGVGAFEPGIRQLQANSTAWTVLMYHRVIVDPHDDPFQLGMCVLVDHFDAHLDYLKRNFRPIGMAEAVRRLQQGESLPPGSVSITFDDGYLDNLTHALPSLLRHEMPMTLFVATGGLHDNLPFWWDRVIAALWALDAEHLDTAEIGLQVPEQRLRMDARSRRSSAETLLDLLWSLPNDAVHDAVRRLEAKAGPAIGQVPMAARMNADDLRRLHAAGVEIGAHSVCHPNLTLMNPAEARSEMQASRAELQSMLDAPVDGFAYPGGYVDDTMVEAAQACGFHYATGAYAGINGHPIDLFRLARIGADDSAVSDFKRSLSRYGKRLSSS